MTDFRRPLGDYVQLLLRHDLLADKGPVHADLSAPVALVSCDSQVVIPHTLFLCKGAKFKEDYLRQAMVSSWSSFTISPRPTADFLCLREWGSARVREMTSTVR